MANKINVALTLETSGFQRSLQMAEKSLARFGRQMANAGETLTQSLTVPLGGLGIAAVKAFGDFERLENSLTAIMGSSEAAGAELERLRKVAENPGLALPEVVKASASLQSVGFSADNARATIEQFGNAVATFGTGGAEAFDGVILALSQISAVGQVTQEDLNQIKERIPGFAQVMKQEFGVTTAEAIRELGISSDEFIERSVGALSKLERAKGGISNAFDNFKDNVTASLAVLGESIATNLNLEQVLTKLSDVLARMVNLFKNLSPAMQKTVVIFAAILAGIGPVLFIVGKLAGAWGVMLTGFRSLISIGPKIAAAWTFITGPIGLTIAAIAGVIAVLVILYKRFEVVRQVINGVGYGFVELGKAAKSVFGNILEGFQNIREGNFKEAAKNLKDAFVGAQPFELGKSFVQGFAKGFEDNTDYLTPAIKKIQNETKKITSSIMGGTSFGAFDAGAGGGGGGEEIPTVDNKALLEWEKSVSNITSNIAKLKQTAKGPFGFIRAELSSVAVFTPELNKQKDALLEYQKAIQLVSNQAAIFGENPLEAQLGATETALKSALETFGPYSEAVRVLADEYDRLKFAVNENKAALESANKEQEFAIELQNVFASAFQAGANAIAGSGKSIIEALKAVGRAALQAASDVLRAKIIEGVASVVADSLKKFGLLGLAVAAGAGAAAGALFQATIGRITTPKLAKGGLAFAPTLATVGDNPGARTDPEVIAPLSKLREYLDGGTGSMIAETRISGNDLLVLVRRAETRDGRIR